MMMSTCQIIALKSVMQDAKSELRNGHQTETRPETRTARRAKTLLRCNELGAGGGGQRMTAEWIPLSSWLTSFTWEHNSSVIKPEAIRLQCKIMHVSPLSCPNRPEAEAVTGPAGWNLNHNISQWLCSLKQRLTVFAPGFKQDQDQADSFRMSSWNQSFKHKEPHWGSHFQPPIHEMFSLTRQLTTLALVIAWQAPWLALIHVGIISNSLTWQYGLSRTPLDLIMR